MYNALELKILLNRYKVKQLAVEEQELLELQEITEYFKDYNRSNIFCVAALERQVKLPKNTLLNFLSPSKCSFPKRHFKKLEQVLINFGYPNPNNKETLIATKQNQLATDSQELPELQEITNYFKDFNRSQILSIAAIERKAELPKNTLLLFLRTTHPFPEHHIKRLLEVLKIFGYQSSQ